jgi:probable rRNA maturation factor
MPRCALTIVNRSGRRPRLRRDRLRAVVDAALAAAKRENCSITVLLVDTKASARLHETHFADPSATDVMTFPDGDLDPETGRRHLGDLAVCVNVARRAAAARRRAVGDELILYILHGLLHLLGHDDRKSRDRAKMWAMQRRLLAGVGIGLELTSN